MVRRGALLLIRCLGGVSVFRKLNEYVFALCDLFEAEARTFAQTARRTALRIVVLLLAGLLLAVGFGFLVAGLYLLLAAALSAWAGALITGGVVLFAGLVVAWLGLRVAR